MELITEKFLEDHGFTYQGKFPCWYHSEVIDTIQPDGIIEEKEETQHFCIWAENDNEWYFYVAGIKIGKPLEYTKDVYLLFMIMTGKYLIQKPFNSNSKSQHP